VCVSSASTGLCGGCRVTGIPTATRVATLDYPGPLSENHAKTVSSMLVRELRSRPHSWSQYKQNSSPLALPFHALEWLLQWLAYYLSRWALLEVLEYLSALSVLFAVIFYFAESGDRQKQKHYQAWQVINTAQGKGGSGGRIEALQELNLDHVPLVGVNAAGAFLQGVQLQGANLFRADLEAADLRDANLQAVDLEYANLTFANFRQANLSGAKLASAVLQDADLALPPHS
jgi:hypothetical protein